MAPQAEMKSNSRGKLMGKNSISRSKRAGLEFPVNKVAQYLKTSKYAKHMGVSVYIYLTAVLKYLDVEVFELAGDAAKDFKSTQIVPRHIQLAIKHDKELNKLLQSLTIAEGGVLPNFHPNETND